MRCSQLGKPPPDTSAFMYGPLFDQWMLPMMRFSTYGYEIHTGFLRSIAVRFPVEYTSCAEISWLPFVQDQAE
jgi:hypothetical protein